MTAPTGYRHLVPLLAACLLAFVIPFPFIFGAVGVAVLAVVTVCFQGRYLIFNLRKRKLLWLPIVLYLWTLCTWFWSADKGEAASILSTKFSLFLLPLVLGSSSLQDSVSRRRVLFSFATGVAVIGAYSMASAWEAYLVSRDANVLFYHQLVDGLETNAVYMAWYVVTAILFLLVTPPDPARSGKVLWVRGLLFAVLLPFFFLLAARTLLFLFLVGVLPVIFLGSFRKKVAFPQKIMTWVFSGVVVLATVLAMRQPAIQARFRELNHSRPELSFLQHYQGEEAQFSNLNVRLFLWRVGWEELTSSTKTFLAGTGVGDTHAAINKRIAALGIPNMEQDASPRNPFYNINLHNTFLHTALATGLPGIVLLLAVVFCLLIAGFRAFPQKPFLLFFTLLALAFMMQEAVLETQAGTIFFMFIWSLYYSPTKRLER